MTTAQTEARAVESVRKWLDGGCSSWGLPSQQIEMLLSALAAKDAEIAALKKEAADVVRPFAEMPLEGTFGGPLCGAKGLYEDGSEPEYNPDRSILGREPFCAARSFLDKWEGRDG